MPALDFRSVAVFLLLVAARGTARPQEQPDIPPSYGQPATPRVVGYVIRALQQGDLVDAKALVAQYRRLNGDTPDALEAYAWVARGELVNGDTAGALAAAAEIKQSVQTALATRQLDAEPHLPLALGSAYEVEAEALASQGKRAEALQLLTTALHTWHGTSLEDRLQKNLNLLTLQGRPVPLLRETEWIGAKPLPQAAWRGKAVLLFFWAHWCADCKAEAPILAKLAAEYESKGLIVVAPTRLYGYTANEEHAMPATERSFVEKVYQKYYAGIPDARVPVDSGNFQRFGASTTPTIVLVNRRGVVELYHPGVMEEAALRAAIEHALATQPVHATSGG